MFRFTKVASNRKTGAIPVSTTAKSSCPDSCPLKGKGCYAEFGPLNLWWNRCTMGEREFLDCVKRIRRGQLWRHNQAGDLLHKGGKIDTAFLRKLTKANGKSNGFTYTHHKPSSHNLKAISDANKGGFTINLSANSPKQAVEYLKHGLPVVTVCTETENFKIDGVQFLICPATKRENFSCADCGLCYKKDRKCVVAFPVHGNGKRLAKEVVNESR